MTRSKPLPWRWISWAAVLGLVTLLTLLPPSAGLPQGPRIPHLDKIVHACAWGLLAALTWWALIPTRSRQRAAPLALAFAVAYGVVIEALQLLVPGRSADPLDLLADAAGAILGVAAISLWTSRRAGPTAPHPTNQARS